MRGIFIGCVLALLFGPVVWGAVIWGGTEAYAASYKRLYSFNEGGSGREPSAGLIRVGGKLYGTARDDPGTVFALDLNGGKEKVIYAFSGGEPMATMVRLGGSLYGITVEGGAYGWGAVYAVQPGTGVERTVYSFQGGTDGYFPEASLLDVRGTLYGTTIGGGAYSKGTVFAVDPASGEKRVVHSFGGGADDGDDPQSSLIDVKGVLYGTTLSGGAHGAGTVFAADPSTGMEKIVYAFSGGQDGGEPYAGLISVAGVLYGAAYRGGNGCDGSGCGTVFSIDPATGKEIVLHEFSGGADGAQPRGNLINVGRLLYGTTEFGGGACRVNGGCGILFSIDMDTGKERVLYAFKSGMDGADPWAALINVGGALYGTTFAGGGAGGTVAPPACGDGCGTIFAYTP